MAAPEFILSHRWRNTPRVRPALIAAFEIRGPYPRIRARMRARTWILDYEFNSFGQVGVKVARYVWRRRPAGSVHLYPPGRQYCEDSRKERGQRHSAWLDFSGGAEMWLTPLVRRHGYARFLDPDGRAGELIHQAAQAAHDSGEKGFWRAQACLCSVVDLLLSARHVLDETYSIEPTGTPAGIPTFVQQVRQYMRDHLSRRFTLEELAREMHVSVSTLAHRYRREAGETPKAASLRLRIEHAKSFLLRGQLFKVVASQLGFADAAHFSKVFKRIEGLSPREFVRKHRCEEP